MVLDNDRGRPPAKETASNVTAGNESSVVRCTCCRRPLRAPESVRREMGPRCWVVAA